MHCLPGDIKELHGIILKYPGIDASGIVAEAVMTDFLKVMRFS